MPSTLIKTYRSTLIKVGNTLLGSLLNYEPELTTYIDGLTTQLSSGQKTKLNTFIRALKTGLNINALSDAFDVMYILANETAETGLRNLVKRAHDATAVNSPVFTPFEGFTGNGTSSYINSNYSLTDGVNQIQNSASLGVYFRENMQKILNSIGAINSSDTKGGIFFSPRNIVDMAYWRSHTALSETSTPVTDSSGLFIINRTASNAAELFQNKSSIEAITTASVAPIDRNLYILATNINGEPSYDERQASFVFLGRGLSQDDINVVTDAIEAYMDSNGKGVIS